MLPTVRLTHHSGIGCNTVFSQLLNFIFRRLNFFSCFVFRSFFSSLSTLSIINNELFIDGHLLNTELIDIIKPFKTSPPHSLLAFAVHLKDKTQLNFMDRPKTVFYKSKNKLGSKSLEILFTTFPTLKGKLKEVQY